MWSNGPCVVCGEDTRSAICSKCADLPLDEQMRIVDARDRARRQPVRLVHVGAAQMPLKLAPGNRHQRRVLIAKDRRKR